MYGPGTLREQASGGAGRGGVIILWHGTRQACLVWVHPNWILVTSSAPMIYSSHGAMCIWLNIRFFNFSSKVLSDSDLNILAWGYVFDRHYKEPLSLWMCQMLQMWTVLNSQTVQQLKLCPYSWLNKSTGVWKVFLPRQRLIHDYVSKVTPGLFSFVSGLFYLYGQ